MTGLRTRLVLLVLAALLPVLGLVVSNALRTQDESLSRAREDLRISAQMAALHQERSIEGARQLLDAVVSAPFLRAGDLTSCGAYFQELQAKYPIYANFGVLDLKGDVRCQAVSTVQPAGPVSFADRYYFKRALTTQSFVVGEYIVGRFSGRKSLNFGMPVKDAQGQMIGVAFAALDLQKIAVDRPLPALPNVHLVVADRNGTLVGADTSVNELIGRRSPEMAAYAGMASLPTEAFDSQDSQGAEKIYAVARTGVGSESGVWVVASVDREEVVQPVLHNLWIDIGWLLAVAAVGSWLAWQIGHALIVAPTRRLLHLVDAVDGRTSTELKGSRNELQDLTTAFKRMVEFVKTRDEDRLRTEADLRRSEKRLITAQRIGQLGNWEFELSTERLWWSDQVYSIFGLVPDGLALSVDIFSRHVFSEDLMACRIARQELTERGGSVDLEFRIITAQGTQRWVHTLGERVVNAQGVVTSLMGTVQDITDRVRNERVLALEAHALKAIALNTPLASVLDDVALGVETIIPGAIGSIHLVSPDGSQLFMGAAPSLPEAYSEALVGLPIGPGAGSYGAAAHLRQTVVVTDIDTDPLWDDYRALAQAHGLRACWAIPIQNAAGDVLATLAVHHREPRTPPPEELAVVQNMARLIAIAIEQSRAEAALQASHQQFRSLFAGAATGIAIANLEHRVLNANQAFCEMTGYSEIELQTKTMGLLTHPEDWPDDQERLRDVQAGRRDAYVTDKRYLAKSGATLWARVSVSALRDSAGVINGVVAISEDVTAHKAAVHALQEAHDLRDMATRMGRLGAWSVDLEAPDSKIELSVKACAIHDLPTGTRLTLEDALGFYAPEDVGLVQQLFADCAERGVPFDTEVHITTALGRKVWIRSIGEAVRSPAGTIVRVQGAVQDISIRKRLDEEKVEAQAQLNSTLDSIRDGFVTINRDWRFTYVNAQAEKLLRRSRADLMGQLFADTFPHVEGTSFFDNYVKAITGKQTVHFEDFYPPLGMWLDLSVYPSRSGLAIYFRDVTAQRSAQKQLRLLEAAVARLNDVVLITEAEPVTEDGPRIVYVNDAFERRTGYTRDEVIGKTPRFLQGPATQRAELDRINAALHNWEPVRAELINYTKAGQPFWLEMEIVPMANEQGWFTHWVSVARDTTERKQAQEAILQLNADLEDRVRLRTIQLEAANTELEAFSYSVSHDLRSPLNTVNGFGQLLLKSNHQNLDDKGKHYLNRIRAGAQQMGDLIEGLLVLARLGREPLRPQAIDLTALARRVEQLCREVEPTRHVELDVHEGMVVHGDATLMMVVMQNLLGNAWKYTSKRIAAHIEVGCVCRRPPGGHAQEGAEVPVYFVKDNGAGFDMTQADRLFGVFQRLHLATDFEGTGVGLANVKRVVERHGGQVWAEAQVDAGATFFFTLGSGVPPNA